MINKTTKKASYISRVNGKSSFAPKMGKVTFGQNV
jgi:hypothetical protein